MCLVPILTDPQCSYRENKKPSLPQSVSDDLEADSSTALSFTETSTAVPSFVEMPTAEISAAGLSTLFTSSKHLTHLHHTSTESSNSTASRTHFIHQDNLTKQHSLVYEILVCFGLPHPDKQWCGWLAPLLEQKGKKGQLPSYILIPLLHEEVKQVSIQVCLINESKLTHQKCLKYCNNQSSVFKHWEDYINRTNQNTITTSEGLL